MQEKKKCEKLIATTNNKKKKYKGPYKRTRETAKLIQEELKSLPVTTDLKENIFLGVTKFVQIQPTNMNKSTIFKGTTIWPF